MPFCPAGRTQRPPAAKRRGRGVVARPGSAAPLTGSSVAWRDVLADRVGVAVGSVTEMVHRGARTLNGTEILRRAQPELIGRALEALGGRPIPVNPAIDVRLSGNHCRQDRLGL